MYDLTSVKINDFCHPHLYILISLSTYSPLILSITELTLLLLCQILLVYLYLVYVFQ